MAATIAEKNAGKMGIFIGGKALPITVTTETKYTVCWDFKVMSPFVKRLNGNGVGIFYKL